MRLNFRYRATLIRLVAAIGMAATLGGCIVVPAGPGFYRPHPYRSYYY